jgi:nicotinate-nucleotide adenylyltransferase
MATDRSGNRRIGIFGGTFNPIHYGHLRMAEEIAEGFALDRVYLVPSARPPHKGEMGLAAAADRLAMVRRAVRGNPRLFACDYECRQSGPSYAVATLERFRRRFPAAELFFLIGWDAWREIATWHRWSRLFELADFVVFSRGEEKLDCGEGAAGLFPFALQALFCYEGGRCYRCRTGRRLHFVSTTRLDISSSRIRELAAAGCSLRYLVPDGVLRYLEERRLYCREPVEPGGIV